MITTIHLLRAGKPLCGFSDDFPRDWPAGNKWQPFDRIDGGLAGEAGVLTMEIQHPEKWRACRGCVKGCVDALLAKGWKFREGMQSNVASLLQSLGLPVEPASVGEESSR